MKVGIIYSTHFGFCEQAARELSHKLITPSEVVSFDYKSRYDLSAYDALVLGGSIRMGFSIKTLSVGSIVIEKKLLKNHTPFSSPVAFLKTSTSILRVVFLKRLWKVLLL